jgi:hypothetical protein
MGWIGWKKLQKAMDFASKYHPDAPCIEYFPTFASKIAQM